MVHLHNRNDGRYYVYVGSYAEESHQGVYWFDFDPETCTLALVDSVSEIENPSFITLDAEQRFLYAVSETAESKTSEGGSVVSYSISKTTGKLLRLNEKLTLGDAPCNLSIGQDDQFLFIANYTGGNVSMVSIDEDGQIGEIEDLVQHRGPGTGIHPDRQEKPHPHAAVLDAGHHYLFVPDLGLDKIFIYKINYTTKKLVPHGEAVLPPGSGPRHFVIDANQAFAYCINELSNTVTVFSYDSGQGMLEARQHIHTLPDDFSGESTCADIHISPSGKFLFASNRGHDSITTFEINEQSGLLTYIRHTSTYGKTPRNFALSPNGQFLLVANQDSDSIVAFEVDGANGFLKLQGSIAVVSKPNFVRIV